MEQTGTDQIVEDLRNLASDTEALVAATAGQGGEKIQQLRLRLQDSLRDAKARVIEAGERVEAQVRSGARALDSQVHERPWQSIGIAAGTAFVIGYLLGRR